MKSMTGYATVNKSDHSHAVQVIIRSTNFKYLDITIRNLPAEAMALEEAMKREIKKKITRGKIEVFVLWEEHQARKPIINERVVARYISQAKALAKKHKIRSEMAIGDILSLPQAISWQQTRNSNYASAIVALRQALEGLLNFKQREGRAIQKEMTDNLKKLKRNIDQIRKLKPSASKAENGKEDIDEEISLMSFYARKLESTISTNRASAKGKSIDFLTQEILRELNAASSKTKQKKAALLIVEAKNYLERIREQTQNIE